MNGVYVCVCTCGYICLHVCAYVVGEHEYRVSTYTLHAVSVDVCVYAGVCTWVHFQLYTCVRIFVHFYLCNILE